MKLQTILDVVAATIGAALGFLFGEVTGLFWALIAFMALDYTTGIINAVVSKKLSSAVGFKGLAKKFVILIFVAVGHIIDTYILGGTPAIMSAVMLFYLANEGISIIENAARLGLPVPKKLVEIMEQLKEKSEEEE
ncbi:MAG: phage holin family protein [Ruminiclostridium sp.]|nr:phage holin family protein [Ruminiclostridium sp.]